MPCAPAAATAGTGRRQMRCRQRVVALVARLDGMERCGLGSCDRESRGTLPEEHRSAGRRPRRGHGIPVVTASAWAMHGSQSTHGGQSAMRTVPCGACRVDGFAHHRVLSHTLELPARAQRKRGLRRQISGARLDAAPHCWRRALAHADVHHQVHLAISGSWQAGPPHPQALSGGVHLAKCAAVHSPTARWVGSTRSWQSKT